MKRTHGFTVIEVLVVLAFIIGASILFLTQKASVDATARDSDRKTAINAMYFNLEEVYYEKNGFYPQSVGSQILRAMDPDLFYDPNGVLINEPNSSLHYEPADCNFEGRCKRYTLRADLEREAEFKKTSRRS